MGERALCTTPVTVSHQDFSVGFAVFCGTQLVSLDWHHMWSCNIQLHGGRPSLSLGSVQKTLECEALSRGFEGALSYRRKVGKTKFTAFLGRDTIKVRKRNAEVGKSCSIKHFLITLLNNSLTCGACDPSNLYELVVNFM